MITNLADYFKPEYEFYLESLSYNKNGGRKENINYSLNYTDIIETRTNSDHVILSVKRVLNVEPEAIFQLEVSFGAILTFNEEYKNDYDWKSIDMSNEFRNNGDFVLNNLLNRICLVISQVTSSYGQPPIILPNTTKKNKQ